MATINFKDIINPFNWFSSTKMIEGDYVPRFDNVQIGDTNPVFLPTQNLSDIYNRVAHLKTVINKVGLMFSNGDWKVINKEGEEVEHPVLELLNKPNVLQSGKDFLFYNSLMMDIFGNSFIYKNKGFTDVKSLWSIPNLEIKTTGKIYSATQLSDIIKGYELNENNAQEMYSPDEIILLKGNGAGEIFAESQIKTLIPQISNIYQAYKSRNVLITERGGIGFVSIERSSSTGNVIPLSQKEKEEAETKFQKSYGINKGQKRTAFTTVPLKFTSTNLPTKDLMLFEEIADDLSVICDAYGYNVNLLKDAKYSNAKEYEKQVYQNTIIPRALKFANVMSEELGLTSQGLTLMLDYSNVQALQEDRKLKAETIEKLVNSLDKLNSIVTEDSETNEIKDKLKQMIKQ